MATLYKRTKTNVRSWSIVQEGSEYYTVYGVHGGSMIQSKSTTCSSEEKCTQKVTTIINGKLREGYSYTISDSRPLNPMLAAEGDLTRVKYPALVQPKLDGVRCLVYLEEGEVVFKSRNGTLFTGFASLRQSLLPLLLQEEIILDGELYKHGQGFNQISGTVRRIGEDAMKDELEYHVFDFISDLSFVKRYKHLTSLTFPASVRLVHSCIAQEDADIMYLQEVFEQDGYEGVMVRNISAPYQLDTRTHDIMKFKKFHTEEFRIIDIIDGNGSNKGLAIFVLEVDHEGEVTSFTASIADTHETRRSIYTQKNLYINKLLTVKFQSKANGIPRFPVGLAIRDYE